MIDFDHASHTYTLGGRRLPSVTRVLDHLGTYAGIPADVLARKADIGDAVHLASEMYDRDELDMSSVPEEIAGYVAGWVRFREEAGFIPRSIEERVWSDRHQFAGTLDRTGTFKKLKGVRQNALALVDLKCTYRLLPAVGAQLSAYAVAWEERNRPQRIKHRFAVRLTADGKYELKEHTDITDRSVFLSALTLFFWKQRHAA